MSARERWLFVRDGKLYLRTENDGAIFLHRGAEAFDEETTLDEVAEGHGWQAVARWLYAALLSEEHAHDSARKVLGDLAQALKASA